jgi:hypothetical protein
MNREAYRKSVFLDQRIKSLSKQAVKRVELRMLIEAFEARRCQPSPLNYIFNFALCGSTLLSRAIDLSDAALVYREPMALAHVALIAAKKGYPDPAPESWGQLLDMTLALLSETYIGQTSVVIKPTVPVNFIIPQLMKKHPENKAILMYLRLEPYLLKVLRGPERKRWALTVLNNQKEYVEAQTGIGINEVAKLSPSRAAACLWLLQMKSFQDAETNFSDARSLDGEALFHNPTETMTQIFAMLGHPFNNVDVNDIVNSHIFSNHSKAQGRKFDADEERKRNDDLRRSVAHELREGIDWVKQHLDRFAVCERMRKPLVGDGQGLLD